LELTYDLQYIMPYDLENTFHIFCNGSNEFGKISIHNYNIIYSYKDENNIVNNSLTRNACDINEIHIENHKCVHIFIPKFANVKYIDDIIIVFRCTTHVYIHTNKILHRILRG
jgi:hypothetical protein